MKKTCEWGTCEEDACESVGDGNFCHSCAGMAYSELKHWLDEVLAGRATIAEVPEYLRSGLPQPPEIAMEE